VLLPAWPTDFGPVTTWPTWPTPGHQHRPRPTPTHHVAGLHLARCTQPTDRAATMRRGHPGRADSKGLQLRSVSEQFLFLKQVVKDFLFFKFFVKHLLVFNFAFYVYNFCVER
jgi:hypothetical protein